MANFDSLKQSVNDSINTHKHCAQVIRGLVKERNDALSAASPEDVKAAREETAVTTEAGDLQTSLERARADADAAINEAGSPPVIKPKPATPPPPPGPTPTPKP